MSRAPVFVIVAIATLGIIACGIIVSDGPGSSVSGSASQRERRIYRLPAGARRTSSRHWVWQNSTVIGFFRVYVADERPIRERRAQAAGCCATIEVAGLQVRLFEPEGYELEAANDGTFSASTIVQVFATAASTWESIVGDRFGSQKIIGDSAGLVFNGKNQIALGALEVDAPNALAVTGLWLVCPSGGQIASCPTKLKISEWDQTYGISEHPWSVTGASGAFDLVSVAVHEFGHNVGLDDLGDAACEPSTMFGFAGFGETHRRTVDDVTKSCARELYGISGGARELASATAVLALLIASLV
jgi:hypothetical protein